MSVLATSREGLEVRGEQIYPLGSLGLPAASDAVSVLGSEAGALFVARAAEAGRVLEVDGPAAQVLQDLCMRLDGIPLAIELAAARTAMMTPAEIVARLDRQFRLLTGGGRTRLAVSARPRWHRRSCRPRSTRTSWRPATRHSPVSRGSSPASAEPARCSPVSNQCQGRVDHVGAHHRSDTTLNPVSRACAPSLAATLNSSSRSPAIDLRHGRISRGRLLPLLPTTARMGSVPDRSTSLRRCRCRRRQPSSVCLSSTAHRPRPAPRNPRGARRRHSTRGPKAGDHPPGRGVRRG